MIHRLMNKKIIFTVVLMFAITSIGVFIGRWTISSVCAEEGYEELKVFSEVLSTPFSILLGLLTLPIAYNSYRILNANYMDKMKMAPANLATIKVHALTLTCLIIGYLAAGIMS